MTARWLAKSSSVRLGCGSGLCRVMNPGMHLRTNQETLNTITTEPYTVKIEVQVLLTHLCTLKLLLSFILCTVITSSIVIHVTIIMITIITRLYHYCYCRNTTCIIMCVYIDTYIHLYIYVYRSLFLSISRCLPISAAPEGCAARRPQASWAQTWSRFSCFPEICRRPSRARSSSGLGFRV